MRSVIILSGGLDSTCLLYSLLSTSDSKDIKAISFNYGQRHKKELIFAQKICEDVGVEHRIVDLSCLAALLPGSSQTDPSVPVPHGHYAAENMKLTVVPNRNMIMLSIAMGWALAEGFAQVVCGVHAGDHAIYPDCRPVFIQKINEISHLCHWTTVKVVAPFQTFTKGGIVTATKHLNVPYKLTWSCYAGLDKHCGACGACTERREAFAEAGIADPTEYANV